MKKNVFRGILSFLVVGIFVLGCASTNTASGGSVSANKLAGTRWIMNGFFGDDVLIFIDETRWELTGFGGQKTWSGTYSIDGDYVYTTSASDPKDKVEYQISKDGNTLIDMGGNPYTKAK
jgi:hypothetical protein